MSRITFTHGQIPDSASECLYPSLYPTIGWWCPSLHHRGGLKIADLTNNSCAGTLVAEVTDWVVDQGKGGLNFITDDYVDIANAARISQIALASRNIAYSAWIKTNSTTGLRIITGATNSAATNPYCVLYQTGTNVGLTIRSDAGVTNTAQSTVTISTGTWIHLVGLVRSGSVQIWINGVLRGSANLTIGATTLNKFAIGAFLRTTNTDFFNGLIDDVRAYNTPLFPEHVRALYQLGRGNLPVKQRKRYLFLQESSAFKSYWINKKPKIFGGGLR